MNSLIGLAGKKQSGKNTVGDLLINHMGFIGLSYASQLKRIIRELYYPFVTEEHTDGALKEVDIPELGCSARYLMQHVGQGLREIDPSVWLREIEGILTCNPERAFVITDVRYDNEAIQIRRFGGELWQMERPDLPDDSDITENSLTIVPDLMILNNGTMEELENLIAHICAEV